MKSAFNFLFWILVSCNSWSQTNLQEQTLLELAKVPIECLLQEYPNKLNQVLIDSSHLATPAELHPIFYGCFDWHSSVHGHWLMASVLNASPDSDLSSEITQLFDTQFTADKVAKELAYFEPKLNQSFERTYGWAWILKLYAELYSSPLNEEHAWTENLRPLTDHIVESYKAFLPKLVYPIRVGEHTNTAFGLSLAYDYAVAVEDDEFQYLIESRAKDYYLNDVGCPLGWEPSGFDFISPCLQEAELMSKILDSTEFETWFKNFLPQAFDQSFELEPGKVLDRTDGKLVHLDGLNFSRAWCFYSIAAKIPTLKSKLILLGDQHLGVSQDQVIGSDYMGSHWLASFLVYALEKRGEINQE